MPKPKKKLPFYRIYKASGQAIVTLGRRDRYLGMYETRWGPLRAQVLANLGRRHI